jgi:hypothetical protein
MISKYETAQGMLKADRAYSLKLFIKFDYKNFLLICSL